MGRLGRDRTSYPRFAGGLVLVLGPCAQHIGPLAFTCRTAFPRYCLPRHPSSECKAAAAHLSLAIASIRPCQRLIAALSPMGRIFYRTLDPAGIRPHQRALDTKLAAPTDYFGAASAPGPRIGARTRNQQRRFVVARLRAGEALRPTMDPWRAHVKRKEILFWIYQMHGVDGPA